MLSLRTTELEGMEMNKLHQDREIREKEKLS